MRLKRHRISRDSTDNLINFALMYGQKTLFLWDMRKPPQVRALHSSTDVAGGRRDARCSLRRHAVARRLKVQMHAGRLVMYRGIK